MEGEASSGRSTPSKKPRNRSTGMHCMAPGCSNNHCNNPELHYHRLPLGNQSLLNEWLAKMKLARPPKLQYARVCSQHFTADDYQVKGQFADSGRYYQEQTSKLKPTAVPTVFDFSQYSRGTTDAPSTSPSAASARSRRHLARQHQQQQQKQLTDAYQVKAYLLSCHQCQ